MDLTRVYNTDCLPAMKDLPDDYFDLAIVDPEYREENQPTQQMRAKGNMKNWSGKSDINYFLELFRVSKEQIIWGGNYYTEFLPPNNNWIVWYKNNDGTGFSMAELAWSSITKNVKVLELRSPQTLQKEPRIHPTQKPVKLYKWLLKNYAKEGDKILDTHAGSQSSRIASFDMGFDYTAYEIDRDYFEAGNKRFEQHKSQLKLFV